MKLKHIYKVLELNRYATDNKLSIVGGAGKLLSYFVKKYNPAKIYSFADLRYTDKNNNLYEKLGFELTNTLGPDYFYMKGYKKRLYKFQFSKRDLVRQGFDPNMSEWEIMKSRGYDRIWDCGKLKYQIKL